MQFETLYQEVKTSTAGNASERIRGRLVKAKHRFHANDNIAAYIQKGELDELREEVELQIQSLLQTLVIDTRNDHNTTDTAKRLARMFIDEVFQGRYVSAPLLTSFPNVAQADEMMLIGPITVRSACSHHLCPVTGKLWIGLIPDASSDLIGLSKYARLTAWIMSRPQIQEEAAVMLADELEERLKPEGLAIAIEARHFCMHWRGVKDETALMRNYVMRGAFKENPDLRHEFLRLQDSCCVE